MKRRYRYTLFSIGLAAVFLFGSMQCMLFLLHRREADLLSQEGKARIESPVKAWGEGEYEACEKAAETAETYVLTTEQIEAAVNSWNNRTWEMTHSPVNGQISMEEAILTGGNWLIEMGIFQGEPEDGLVSAVLGVGNQKKLSDVQLEPFYSFWTVRFAGQSMLTTLYINAVSGRVYGAEIIFYEQVNQLFEQGLDSYDKLELFALQAGLEGTVLMLGEDKTQASLFLKNTDMKAEMNVSSIWTYDINETIYQGFSVVDFKLM